MIQTSKECHNEGIIISLQEVLKIYTCALIIVGGCSLPVDKYLYLSSEYLPFNSILMLSP